MSAAPSCLCSQAGTHPHSHPATRGVAWRGGTSLPSRAAEASFASPASPASPAAVPLLNQPRAGPGLSPVAVRPCRLRAKWPKTLPSKRRPAWSAASAPGCPCSPPRSTPSRPTTRLGATRRAPTTITIKLNSCLECVVAGRQQVAVSARRRPAAPRRPRGCTRLLFFPRFFF